MPYAPRPQQTEYRPCDSCGYTNDKSIDCTKKAIYAAQPAACQTCDRIDHPTVECKYPCGNCGPTGHATVACRMPNNNNDSNKEVNRSQLEECQESEIEYDDSSILEPDGCESYPQSNIMLGLRTNLALWCCKDVCTNVINILIEESQVASYDGNNILTDLGDVGGCKASADQCISAEGTILWEQRNVSN
uniref:CCHC-type domain-containing protein n=1 Tax=Romanomermis culicivorax TaxID=13658 RepID=A0A915KIE9_ROMCU